MKAEPWTNKADICGCVNMDKENGVLAALLDVSNYLKKFGSKKQKFWFKNYFRCGLFGYGCTNNNAGKRREGMFFKIFFTFLKSNNNIKLWIDG